MCSSSDILVDGLGFCCNLVLYLVERFVGGFDTGCIDVDSL